MEADEALMNAFNKFVRDHSLWLHLYRLDRLTRLNRYAILMFGTDGTQNTESPLRNVSEVRWLRAYGARQITEISLGQDATTPIFGRPEMYTVAFQDPHDRKVLSDTTVTGIIKDRRVHASRTLHIVENPLEDDIIGIPIIEKCYNLLDDLLKVAGGTAETYWLGANKGIHADIDPELDVDPDDEADLADEIEEYQHQLRRFIRTRGVTLKDLGSTSPNPGTTFDMIITLLSGTSQIPKRILLGSEAGQLASEQDRANWAERIEERRTLFAEPIILNPLVSWLQNYGLLPEGDWEWHWPSAFTMNPLEDSMVMAQRARAIGNISRQTGNQSPMQLTTREEGRNIIGLEGDIDEQDVFQQDTVDADFDNTSDTIDEDTSSDDVAT